MHVLTSTPASTTTAAGMLFSCDSLLPDARSDCRISSHCWSGRCAVTHSSLHAVRSLTCHGLSGCHMCVHALDDEEEVSRQLYYQDTGEMPTPVAQLLD